MTQLTNNHEDPRLAQILEIIFKFAAGDLSARGELSGDDSALDGVMAGINILGEELEAKITENERVQQALKESEALLRSIFDSVQDGIILAESKSRKFRMANAAMCQMLGYSSNEMLSLGVEDVHPKDGLDHAIRQFDRMAMDEIDMAPDIPMMRMDGTVFYVDISSGLMMIEGVACLVGVFRDITERKEAEEQIRNLNKALEEKMEQLLEAQEELVRKEKLSVLGQVAGSVGHELRNPLGVMNNAVYFLKTVLSDADETIKEYLGIIQDEIGNADRIVEDLLDSVRTKAPQPKMVTIGSLIEQALNKCIFPETVTVSRHIPDDLPQVKVDPLQMQQVFRNLISNGIEAMPEGGELEISAVENKAEGNVAIFVRDNGTGIAPDVLARLFQPLYTTKARGIGLGLVVVKNLTQANGGKVEVQSEVGKGTTFTVTLPLING